jgi:2',3'-cyclic-nucleotide 2'-phosphodiesterase (5'-nucleotidase family)
MDPRAVRRIAAALAFAVGACLAAGAGGPAADPRPRYVTILYTTDFHSAFDPIPAYWLPGSPKLGGAAQLATMVKDIRRREETVFLFDAGDMFTGMLSNLTRGDHVKDRALRLKPQRPSYPSIIHEAHG